MNSNFKIYDASAGSGKTFNLASNYIVTAMISGFENILAVTFTNAAAKEMKDRIIEVLQSLSENRNDSQTLGYRDNIQRLYREKTGILLSNEDLKNQADVILKQILHRYSFFNVSTIDSFFQLVLKNLTKELGVNGNFILSLNPKKYDELAVKSFVDLNRYDDIQREKITDWLNKFFTKKVDDGKSWNIEKELLKFTQKAFSSYDVVNVLQSDKSELLSIENLEKVRKKLSEDIKQFKDNLIVKRKAFLDKCKECSLSVNDFKGKSRGSVYAVIDKKIPSDITEEMLDNKEYPDEVAFETEDIINYLHNNYERYTVNMIYYNCIYPLGVINNIARIRSSILKNENIFLLNDTAYLLSKLNEGDVPFVFEKISQRIDNIFIDEFQDTNRISFNNLRKIMEECLYNNGSSSVFGDIKQSIYRWSGGDYAILQSLTEQHQDNVIHLLQNFRSLGNIVNFNNDFFKPVYEKNNIQFVPQQTVRQDNSGIVRIKFIDKQEDYFDYIKNEIDYYTDEKGYALNDIAILFRSNEDLIDTAGRLKNDVMRDYNPVSDIAFRFSSSLAVNRIIAALRYMYDSSADISKAIMKADDTALKAINVLAKTYKKEKSLLEVVMKTATILQIDDDAVFLPAFYDTVKDYIKTNFGDIKDFLDYWDETLNERNVDMSGVRAGVNLTSIHKSKGLAYKVVIVPYCDKSFYRSEDLWITDQSSEALLPVITAGSSKLENTRYDDSFRKEKNAQYVDLINMMYVAFTRSRDNLSIISKKPSEKALIGEAKSFNVLLYKYVTESGSKDFASLGGNLFLYRNCEQTEIQKNDSQRLSAEEVIIDKIVLNENNITFSAATDDDLLQYFSGDYKELTQREKGTKYHSYVSKLLSKEDKQAIIDRISDAEQEKQEVENIIDAMLDKTKKLHWFDNTYKILNERNICIPKTMQNGLFSSFEDSIKRPDRIMYNDKEVVIVDYKFGKREDRYKKQVCEYMSLIHSMPAFKDKNINGFLWYIDTEDPLNMAIEKC